MKLSENFTLAELTNSHTAKKLGINNVPNENELSNLKYLCEKVLQPLRTYFGEPINITVGFRCDALNKAVKGSKTSFHKTGCAVDIDNDGSDLSNAEIFKYIKESLPYTELIWEKGSDSNPGWVHVAIKKGRENEKETLRTKNGIDYYPIK